MTKSSLTKTLVEILEEQIVMTKTLRKESDELIQRVKNLEQSEERDIAIRKMQEATMWLGMNLKRLGAVNPYPSSKDPTTGSIVEPTADGLKF